MWTWWWSTTATSRRSRMAWKRRRSMCGLTKALVRLLQERTEDGYVLRVDLRLRPIPARPRWRSPPPRRWPITSAKGRPGSGPPTSMARPMAGDLEVGRAVLADLLPFVWRRVLDYQAIADVHAMKREIHAFRGHDVVAVEGHNVKLGRGGIREWNSSSRRSSHRRRARSRPTVSAHPGGPGHAGGDRWIAPEVRDDLAEAYVFLRRVEHRLQMVADAQTHSLPEQHAALKASPASWAMRTATASRPLWWSASSGGSAHYAQLFEDNAPPRLLARRTDVPGRDGRPRHPGALSAWASASR